MIVIVVPNACTRLLVGTKNTCTRLRVGFGATVEFGASTREKLVQALVQALVQEFFAVSLLISYLSKNACTKLLESEPLDTLQGNQGNT